MDLKKELEKLGFACASEQVVSTTTFSLLVKGERIVLLRTIDNGFGLSERLFVPVSQHATRVDEQISSLKEVFSLKEKK